MGVAQSAEPGRDWVACARVLLEFGVPRAHRDSGNPDEIDIGGASRPFSDEVTDVLLGVS